ncbi:MAG: Gldg family protein [Candidatus Pseudobacter hemicellulosilyticus]|uniref:Gldg family protein n=1 Tax=Candidatus Pseudobacter hemicellulosilyticus TaxID=3121375 RepID=A0AAJ5WMT7_9BACT|nr:MAG: Gldg family protein [Pseudobacter sp.]
MKIIAKVTRTELRTLFYSPIAWFLMIVFLIQCGVVYFSVLEMLTKSQELHNGEVGYTGFRFSLTDYVYLGPMGLFGKVMQNLYLYVPLLTMSLISRELSSGTIKLLYSSPVKVYEIIMGKYLAMLLYSFILVMIAGIFLFAGMFHIAHPQTAMLLSAMLGLFLLLAAYSAIGLFMSCLTSYQVVAAISTFVMIGVLSYIGSVGQDIAFVRTLTYYLSISGRTQNMLAGLITTKDILYFGVIVFIFLGFSILKIRGGMESRPALVKAGRYIAVVAVALAIGWVSSLPGCIGYADVTFNRSRSLTPRVQELIADLGDEPLQVTAYANLLDRYFYLGNPRSFNQNQARWESYLRFKPTIQLNTVMYYDSVAAGNSFRIGKEDGKTLKEKAAQYAKTLDVDIREVLTPQEIRKRIDLRPENNRYVMQLTWKGRSTFLRVFDDIMVWPSETEVAAAIRRLQRAGMPRIAFVTGSLERDIDRTGDRDYKTLTNLPSFRNSLVNQGFDVLTLSLEQEAIPADISTLVLADPKLSLQPVVLEKIRAYISRGGNLLLAGEPGRQEILNPLLSELGVQLNAGMLIQESRNDGPGLVKALLDTNAAPFYTPLQKAIKDSMRLTMPGVTGLSVIPGTGFVARPLAVTAAGSTWQTSRKLDLETLVAARFDKRNSPVTVANAVPAGPGNTKDTAGTVFFSAADGDEYGPVVTVAGLTRTVNGKEQRIVVAGDADFISNKELTRNGTSNFVFSTSLFRWLSHGEFPVDTSRPEAEDKKIRLTLDELKFQRLLFVWAAPALLLIVGAVLLVRRKRK